MAEQREVWSAVDDYVTRLLVKPDPALESAVDATARAGMPPIAVSAPQGKLLALLAQITGARRILEIGTLGGYSTIWMARALPADGRLISLEVDPGHAEVATANLAAAGVDKVTEIRIGPALETLPKLAEEGAGPFDLVFIDADKANIPEYLDWSIRLARPGTVIVVDNVVRDGALLDDSGQKPDVVGVRRLHEMLSDRPPSERHHHPDRGRQRVRRIHTGGRPGLSGGAVPAGARRSARRSKAGGGRQPGAARPAPAGNPAQRAQRSEAGASRQPGATSPAQRGRRQQATRRNEPGAARPAQRGRQPGAWRAARLVRPQSPPAAMSGSSGLLRWRPTW